MVENEGNEQDKGSFLDVPPFQGEQELAGALEQCIIYACEQGAHTLCFCDGDFAAWPLSNERVIDALTQWARSPSNQRRLTVIAATYLTLEREHGVWKRWLRTWGHRVSCLEVNSEFDAEVPCVFLSDNVMLSVRNKDTCAGYVTQEKADLVPMRLRLNELEKNSSPAFSVTTLGL